MRVTLRDSGVDEDCVSTYNSLRQVLLASSCFLLHNNDRSSSPEIVKTYSKRTKKGGQGCPPHTRRDRGYLFISSLSTTISPFFISPVMSARRLSFLSDFLIASVASSLPCLSNFTNLPSTTAP